MIFFLNWPLKLREHETHPSKQAKTLAEAEMIKISASNRCEAHVALFNSNYFVYVVVEYNFLFYLKFNIIIQIILMFGAIR